MDTINLNEEKLKILVAKYDLLTANPQPQKEYFEEVLKLIKEIEALQKKIAIDAKRATLTAEEIAEAEKNAKCAVGAFVEKYRIHHVSQSNEWWFYDHGEWVATGSNGFFEKFHCYLSDKDAYELFQRALDAQSRKVNFAHYSWKHQAGYLNLLDIDKFCPVVEQDEPSYHPIFDLLIRSISGDKGENVRHTERLVLAKYLHPENVQLPALVLGDAGGTGKSLFVSGLLTTVFNRHNVADGLSMEMAFGKFNKPIAGKVIVFVNETPDYDNDKGILRVIGSPTIPIEAKGKDPIMAANSALYIIATNPTKGGHTVHLAHSDVDRRFSIIFGGKPLKQYVTDFYDLSPTNNHEAGHRKIVDELQYVLKNQHEVGKWLHAMIVKHGDVTYVKALHGADYTKQASETVDLITRVCEAVFHAKDEHGRYNFEYIRGEVMHQLAVAAGCKHSQQNFYNAVASWLAENAPLITRVSAKAWKDLTKTSRKTAMCFISDAANANTTLRCNDAIYGQQDDYHRWTWNIDVF